MGIDNDDIIINLNFGNKISIYNKRSYKTN
jgi:hypothetical protein